MVHKLDDVDGMRLIGTAKQTSQRSVVHAERYSSARSRHHTGPSGSSRSDRTPLRDARDAALWSTGDNSRIAGPVQQYRRHRSADCRPRESTASICMNDQSRQQRAAGTVPGVDTRSRPQATKLSNAGQCNAHGTGINPLCGDKLHLYLCRRRRMTDHRGRV